MPAWLRYSGSGGEEFAILLPDTNLKLATKTAEIIGNTIWQMKLAVSDENPFDRQTISIGVAELHEDVITSKSDLISHADRFLYDAKNKGRNTIVSSLGSTSLPSSNIVKFNPDSGN